MNSFFGEVGIHPLTKPGFVLTPAQPFAEEHLIQPAALHRNPFLLAQVGHQPIQSPGGEGQAQRLWWRQSGGDDFSNLFTAISGWAAVASRVFEPRHAVLFKAVQPQIDR